MELWVIRGGLRFIVCFQFLSVVVFVLWIIDFGCFWMLRCLLMFRRSFSVVLRFVLVWYCFVVLIDQGVYLFLLWQLFWNCWVWFLVLILVVFIMQFWIYFLMFEFQLLFSITGVVIFIIQSVVVLVRVYVCRLFFVVFDIQ